MWTSQNTLPLNPGDVLAAPKLSLFHNFAHFYAATYEHICDCVHLAGLRTHHGWVVLNSFTDLTLFPFQWERKQRFTCIHAPYLPVHLTGMQSLTKYPSIIYFEFDTVYWKGLHGHIIPAGQNLYLCTLSRKVNIDTSMWNLVDTTFACTCRWYMRPSVLSVCKGKKVFCSSSCLFFMFVVSEAVRAPVFRHGTDKNGFHLSFSKNFRQVFGDEVKYWPIPIFSRWDHPPNPFKMWEKML